MRKVILFATCLFAIATVNAQEVVEPKKKVDVRGGGQKNPVEKNTESTEQVKNHDGHHSGGKQHHDMKTPTDRAQQSVDALNKRVALTEDQKTKVNSLAMVRLTKADAIRDKYKGSPENKATAKAELETVRKEYRQQVKSLLTPEQIASLKEYAKSHPKKGEGMGKGQGQHHGKGKGLDKPKEVKEAKETEQSVDEFID